VDKTALPIEKQVAGFNLDGENLWYIQGQYLKEYNIRTKITTTVFSNLPPADTAEIIRGEGNTFLLLGNSLYALNDTLEKIYDGVTFANYDFSAHELLFSGANEILIYEPQQKNTQLILRSIGSLSSPLMNFYSGYVFFKNENKIKAIELDGRDHRNIYTILDLAGKDTKFTVNADGSIVTTFGDGTLANFRIR
jgi:hypothetical protein